MPVQVSRVIYLISIFNGTCNIYVTYYVTSRKDTFNRRFLGNWHARKSENSLESDCSNRTWQSSIHEYEYDLWSMAGCIRAYAKYPCVGIDPWNARYNVRCWFASDVFRCLRFFAQLSVFCVRLSRCIDVSSPAIYWYRHREIRLTRLRSLIFQASPPFSPIVHASIDHVVGGREEGEGEGGWKFAQIFRNDKNFLSRFLHTYVYTFQYLSVESRAIIAASLPINVPPSDCFPIFRDIFRFRRIYIVSRLNNKSMF